jgi:hypothetical protein
MNWLPEAIVAASAGGSITGLVMAWLHTRARPARTSRPPCECVHPSSYHIRGRGRCLSPCYTDHVGYHITTCPCNIYTPVEAAPDYIPDDILKEQP